MEPEGQEREIEMQSEPIVIGGGAVNSVNGKTGNVVLTTSDLENDSDYQTGTEVDDAISTAVEAEATARENADNNLQEQIDGKQDTLTAGENITIENNVISASGGSSVTPVQSTGTSTTDVMSQNATSSMVFADPGTDTQIKIGHNTTAASNNSIAIGSGAGAYNSSSYRSSVIGYNARSYNQDAVALGAQASISGNGDFGVAIGRAAGCSRRGAVALGAFSDAIYNGEVNIGSTDSSYGYNNTNYRLLSGVHDPVNAHDAATKGYVDAQSGGGVKTLTADDYNYPTDNPNTVALWLLDDGLYMLPGASSTVSVTGALSGSQLSEFNRMFTNHNVLYALKHGNQFWLFRTASSSYGPLGNYSGFYKCSISGAGNFGFDKTYQTMTFEQLYNDLTTTTAGNGALDANQGRVLKELIDSLVITGAGAPTTSTTGTVGQLYEDTTNGKLYQCTAVSGSTYTWSEVGAGGGGSITPVQTTGTSTTDVMSQDATTKMIYPDIASNPYKMVIGDGSIGGANKGVAINGVISSGLNSGGIAIGAPDGSYAQIGQNGRANSSVAIGSTAAVGRGYNSVSIGASSYCNSGQDVGENVAIGYNSYAGNATATGTVALGARSKPTRQGEVNVGNTANQGFNNTAYRVIGGVHDGQDAHDVVTVEQLNATIDAINTATGSSIPHVGA